ncbi:unnamed protein product [Fusarium graminearum]|nr:unnamed protein product [Fusarium graminearum]
MPVPFEALLPYAIMIGMFGISGTGLAVIKGIQNEGKRPRYSVDQWDRVCAALDIMIHELTREFSWKHAFLKQQYDGLERMVTKATQINKCNYTIWVRGINSKACRMGGSYEGEFNNFKQFISSYHEIC